MGLDMYLLKKTFIGGIFEHNNVHGTVDLSVCDRPVKVQINRLWDISEVVGYWRKAHTIHRWFVENVQGGVDNGAEYLVNYEDMINLLAKVEIVLKDPTQAVSMFGTNNVPEVDGFFMQHMRETRTILKKVTKEANEKRSRASFYYWASW